MDESTLNTQGNNNPEPTTGFDVVEGTEETKPEKLENNWRNPDGTLKPGHPPMGGRPKGKSLKEYWKQRFSEMSDEEKEEFSKKVAPELLWRMAEGNPTEDKKLGGEVKVIIAHETEPSTDTNQEG